MRTTARLGGAAAMALALAAPAAAQIEAPPVPVPEVRVLSAALVIRGGASGAGAQLDVDGDLLPDVSVALFITRQVIGGSAILSFGRGARAAAGWFVTPPLVSIRAD